MYMETSFAGKYTTRKIHAKPHLGPEWRTFYILTGPTATHSIKKNQKMYERKITD